MPRRVRYEPELELARRRGGVHVLDGYSGLLVRDHLVVRDCPAAEEHAAREESRADEVGPDVVRVADVRVAWRPREARAALAVRA